MAFKEKPNIKCLVESCLYQIDGYCNVLKNLDLDNLIVIREEDCPVSSFSLDEY